jgi:hypothetical protein
MEQIQDVSGYSATINLAGPYGDLLHAYRNILASIEKEIDSTGAYARASEGCNLI